MYKDVSFLIISPDLIIKTYLHRIRIKDWLYQKGVFVFYKKLVMVLILCCLPLRGTRKERVVVATSSQNILITDSGQMLEHEWSTDVALGDLTRMATWI